MQKRFRARQKAKSQTIEVQLAETTAQLNELKLKQKQLEARNALLEKVAALNRQPSTGSSPSLGSDDSSSVWPPSLLSTVQVRLLHNVQLGTINACSHEQ